MVPRHLLVDGSNVLHAWSDTKALVRRDREAAKGLLLRKVAVLHDHLGWRVTVVFDGRGDAVRVESVGEQSNFVCVHSPAGTTADDIIEQLVAQSSSPATCLVVTGDQAERSTVEASGANWCGPDELAKRIDSANTQQARLVSQGNDRSQKNWRAPREIGTAGHP